MSAAFSLRSASQLLCGARFPQTSEGFYRRLRFGFKESLSGFQEAISL